MEADNMPKGQMVYRKRNARLRPPRYRKTLAAKKTYFDDDGNAYTMVDVCIAKSCGVTIGLILFTSNLIRLCVFVPQAQDSQDEREMQTDEECTEVKSETEKVSNDNDSKLSTDETNDSDAASSQKTKDIVQEASQIPLPDNDASLSDIQENDEPKVEGVVGSVVKRRRRQKRHKVDNDGVDISDMPAELADDPKMRKYWKKRHSLFHR